MPITIYGYRIQFIGYIIILYSRGVSSGGLRGLERPAKVWYNSQLSSCVTTIVTDKQQLVAKTNNKLTGLTLNGSFSQLL